MFTIFRHVRKVICFKETDKEYILCYKGLYFESKCMRKGYYTLKTIFSDVISYLSLHI